MKQFKKVLLLMLVFLQIICVGNVQVKAATVTEEGLEISLTTDKKEYLQGEEIQVFLNIKNNSGMIFHYYLLIFLTGIIS